METTLTLDEGLLARATGLTGLSEQSALLQEALKALIARESARHLAALAGYDPNAEAGGRL